MNQQIRSDKPTAIDAKNQIRLNKFLAERLGWSRREADARIAAGEILVNDLTGAIGQKIDKNDKVLYNGKIVPYRADFLYLVMNKPAGVVCSRRGQGGAQTIYDLLPREYRELKTVGRLDKDSSGLILLTNDGDFAFKMTHPKFAKTKMYFVELDRELEPLHQQMIAEYGVEIGDGVSRLGLSRMREEDRRGWVVTMSEGRNRQIRRTFGALGYTVVRLHRMEFGRYRLGELKTGEFRLIDP